MISFSRRAFQALSHARISRSYSRAFSNKSTSRNSVAPRLFRHRFVPALAFGLVSGLAVGLYSNSRKKQYSRISSDAPAQHTDSIDLQPTKSDPPFPPTMTINHEIFQALGTGIRTVTFVNFHVYAAGIYIAADDVHTAREILTKFSPSLNPSNDVQRWSELLKDPEQGREIINALLKNKVRFAVRIVPTRNTDFGHLRDGFVRSITNSPEFKQLQNEEIGESVEEVKRAFSRKRKLRKGEVVVWSRDVNGGMSAWYGDSEHEKELLGSASSPEVSRMFFLQYLSGAKPISPSLKESVMKGLVSICI